MKLPDLSAIVEMPACTTWNGLGASRSRPPRRTPSSGIAPVDLGKAKDKATLFAELDRALALPEHFGHNWDALADVLEDRDWLGKRGRVIAARARAPPTARTHPNDWATLEEILGEAADSGASGTCRSGSSSADASRAPRRPRLAGPTGPVHRHATRSRFDARPRLHARPRRAAARARRLSRATGSR